MLFQRLLRQGTTINERPGFYRNHVIKRGAFYAAHVMPSGSWIKCIKHLNARELRAVLLHEIL